MSPSPRTLTRRRKSSINSVDLPLGTVSQKSNGYASRNHSFSRTSSQYSIGASTTPRPPSSHDKHGDFPAMNDNGDVQTWTVGDAGNGLGNLADELAEAWDEDEEICALQTPNENDPPSIPRKSPTGTNGTPFHCPATGVASDISLSPPKMPMRAKHRRMNSQYDGSNYSDNSDAENADGISPSLQSQMAAVECLARRRTEADGSDRDDVVHRIAESLKRLPSQSRIENSTSRLITAHTALTSHLNSQARLLQALAHPLINPLALPPPPEVIDEILPLLATLLASLPIPTARCLASLQSLSASTSELQSILTYLSDAVYMTRQTMTSASRKLRTATDMVLEMRRDAQVREEAVWWIEKGGWNRRLGDRESGRVCGEVIGGFERVCETWRERLVAGVGAA